MQIARNLTEPEDGFLRSKRYLILDREHEVLRRIPRRSRPRGHPSHSINWWAVGITTVPPLLLRIKLK
jgi:hypothetical protein